MIKKMKNRSLFIYCFCLMMFLNVGNVYAASDLGCDGIFGDPADPNSVANLIKMVLDWFRILAPILVISLGTVDLFKAVIASREDEMKKAQTTLMKRVMLGVALFFVPSVINFVIDLASSKMGFEACMFRW